MAKIKDLRLATKLMFVLLIIVAGIAIYFLITNFVVLTNVFIGESKITMTKEVKEALDEIYVDNRDYEIPVCLGGIITEDEIIINSWKETDVVFSNSSTANYVECPAYIGDVKTIGTVHNHPNGFCRLSPTDLNTYAGDLRKGQIVIGLYCDKYLFYLLGVIQPEIKTW